MLTSKLHVLLNISAIIHQHGVEIFNKTCSFEISIGLLPLILIVSTKESPSWKSHENPSTWG